jgi:hypothetical protein
MTVVPADSTGHASVGDVGRELTDRLAGHEVIEVTLSLAEHLPGTWPGHMPCRATVWTWFADRPGDLQPVRPKTGDSYQTRWLVMDEHTVPTSTRRGISSRHRAASCRTPARRVTSEWIGCRCWPPRELRT